MSYGAFLRTLHGRLGFQEAPQALLSFPRAACWRRHRTGFASLGGSEGRGFAIGSLVGRTRRFGFLVCWFDRFCRHCGCLRLR